LRQRTGLHDLEDIFVQIVEPHMPKEAVA
jgi:hypothetical protein